MNISVTNLDQGYKSCETLNTLAKNDGEKLISDLSVNIANLKNHWKGTDATAHITNLCTVYSAMIDIVDSAKKITSVAGSAMSALQEVRRANGGTGEVGAALPNNAPDATAIQPPEETTEYYCDPAAKTDYTTLDDICKNFATFKNKFVTERDTLMANWTAGANREGAQQSFSNFEENAVTYEKYLTGARSNLETAIQNIQSVA